MTARLPAVTFAIGLAAAALMTMVAVLGVPAALDAPSSATLIPWAVAGLLVFYATLGWTLLRRPRSGDTTAVAIGLVAGASWSAEIFVGGPVRVSYATEQALGATFALAAVIVTLSASSLVARRVRAATNPWRTGTLAGLTSGLLVFVFAVAMTLVSLGALATRDDYRRQFVTSGATTMKAFLVQDILTAACAHLLINLLLGLGGAGLAVAVARARSGPHGRNGSSGGRLATPPS